MKSAIAVIALAVLSASATPIPRNDAPTDADILNYALTLEHLENNFYQGALAQFDQQAFLDAGLPEWARGRFQQVADHEAAHVNFLSDVLGDKAVQPCTYKFPYTDPDSFASLSQILEGVGVSAYSGAAQFITDKTALTAAAVVLSTEARHASWISSAINKEQPWSAAFDVPLSLNQVFSLAAPFIESCPESNPSLPVKAFPSLTVDVTAAPGEDVTLTYEGGDDSQFAIFLTGGLTTTAVPIKEGKATIPEDARGTVYVIISSSQQVSDDATIAGPAFFNFQFDSNGNLF